MAEYYAHEAKPANDGQHSKVLSVSRENVLPPVQRLQVINQLTSERQSRAGSNREPIDRTLSSIIFLAKEFYFYQCFGPP